MSKTKQLDQLKKEIADYKGEMEKMKEVYDKVSSDIQQELDHRKSLLTKLMEILNIAEKNIGNVPLLNQAQ